MSHRLRHLREAVPYFVKSSGEHVLENGIPNYGCTRSHLSWCKFFSQLIPRFIHDRCEHYAAGALTHSEQVRIGRIQTPIHTLEATKQKKNEKRSNPSTTKKKNRIAKNAQKFSTSHFQILDFCVHTREIN